ncbi:winged helix-turn-helix transcriptional regulator [Streptomyces sp. NPDC058989]|uniref:winged helix-turn-helix transcriptional regulator n=1 Tax=Streptomyces sp. NPDC058989 TaxID=3346686 RepID=UPI00367F35BC
MAGHRKSAHDAVLVSEAIDRLAPRWTTWTLQTIAQHGQMRFAKIAAALPWLSAQNTQQILRRMHTNGLLDRPEYGIYEVSRSGRNAHSVHRTLASWHRTHSSGSSSAVAEAERTEDALRRLRGERALSVLHARSEHGPLPNGELRKASGLATGSFYYRLQQLQEDQFPTRTGPSSRAASTLAPAAQALGPIYAELAAFESLPPRVTVPHKPTALASASATRAVAAVRRTPSGFPGLFSHAPAPSHVSRHTSQRSPTPHRPGDSSCPPSDPTAITAPTYVPVRAARAPVHHPSGVVPYAHHRPSHLRPGQRCPDGPRLPRRPRPGRSCLQHP